MTVLIAGGGIGGLTLALSLHQVGIPCRIFEAVERLAPLGVGINVLPHAVRELTELGLQDELLALGIPTARLAYYSRRGQEIWSEPRGRDAGYAWPQISIHRGELQMLLTRTVLDRLGPDAIAPGHALTSWEDRGDRIAARFADRGGARIAEVAGDILIAADGIHSAARAALHPDEGPPIWNGAILWRGTAVAAPFLGGRTMIMAGHEYQKFVCYPLRDLPDGRQLINFIAERKFSPDQPWRREDWNRAGRVEDYLPPFETWAFDWLDVPGLIRAAETVYEYPMVDRDPLDAWSHGRLTLLGDAAHPMYPIGSNGASQAILDARVLTRELLAQGLSPAALRAYEAERLPATAKIVTANRGNGPEQVMQMVEERAPDGFDRIDDVLSAEEREGTAAAYKRLAGFDKDALNARPPIVPEAAA
ncbi:flavin-dependent oxidoreductase [Thalassobaculum salexigens]|uniref:flavin-dependent oxidoreductase n=1 Tax=Thalassobaculum salexigens TaxID=455360 RepID=UPI00248DE2B8|nr:flavin-dependent oxidoreductase [Thalassobaculum salexigens]